MTITNHEDEPRFTALQVIKAIGYLEGLTIRDLIQHGYINMQAVIEDIPPSSYTVTLTFVGEKVIGAIKVIRENSRWFNEGHPMGLIEAKALTDAVRDGEATVVLTTTSKEHAEALYKGLEQNGSVAYITPVI